MDGKHPASFAQPIYDVHLPDNRTSLTVPAEFFQPGTHYELEIVAIEASGNQTIHNGYFTTLELSPDCSGSWLTLDTSTADCESK